MSETPPEPSPEPMPPPRMLPAPVAVPARSGPSVEPPSRLDRSADRFVEVARALKDRSRDTAAKGPALLRRLLTDALVEVYAEPVQPLTRADLERRLATADDGFVTGLAAKVPGAALALRATRVGSKLPVAKAVGAALAVVDLAGVLRTGVHDLQDLVRFVRAQRPELPPEEAARIAVTAYLDPTAPVVHDPVPLTRLARTWGYRAVRGTSERARTRAAARRAAAVERLSRPG
jgi:hypothetical protein